MGNWNCLYHWLECATPADAESVYRKLEGAEAFPWSDPGRWALQFGFLSPTVLQAVTSQKAGLELDFPSFLGGDEVRSVVQSGVDRDVCFRLSGQPSLWRPECNLVVAASHADYPLGQHKLAPGEALLGEFRGKKALRLARPVAFSAPFLDSTQLTAFAARQLVEALQAPGFTRSHTTPARSVTLALGRECPAGTVLWGMLRFDRQGAFAEVSPTGCFNALERMRTLGPFCAPLEEQPRLA